MAEISSPRAPVIRSPWVWPNEAKQGQSLMRQLAALAENCSRSQRLCMTSAHMRFTVPILDLLSRTQAHLLKTCASINRETASIHIRGFMGLFPKQVLKLPDEAPCETLASAVIPDTASKVLSPKCRVPFSGSTTHQHVSLKARHPVPQFLILFIPHRLHVSQAGPELTM